jgi:hypothetical protein
MTINVWGGDGVNAFAIPLESATPADTGLVGQTLVWNPVTQLLEWQQQLAANNTYTPTAPMVATTVQAAIDEITGVSGAGRIPFIQSGTGAVATTAQTELRRTVHIKQFGAVCDGVTDDTTAIQNALNSGADRVLASGTPKFTAQLTVPGFTTLEGEGKYQTVFTKAFNGDALILGTGSILKHLQINGQGATYTGRGVLINTGTTNQTIDVCFLKNFSDYCLEFTAASAGSGFHATPGTEMWRTVAGDVCVKLPTDVSASPRHFNGVNTSSYVLVDTGGADNTLITGCYTRNITYGTASAKVIAVGNRISTTGSNCTINGVNHIFSGNDVAGSIELGSSLTSSTISGNYSATTPQIIDNSASSSNFVDRYETDFTPVWTASSVNPVLNDGTLTGRLFRAGRTITVQMYLTIGASTTTGTGIWTFSLPASLSFLKASRVSMGSAYGLRTGVAFQVGATITNTSPTTLGITIISHAGSNNWGPAVPVTWAANDYVRMQVTYELA